MHDTPEIKNKVEYRKRLKSLLNNSHIEKDSDERLIKNLNAVFNSHFKSFPNKKLLIGVFAPIQDEPKILRHLQKWDDHLCFPAILRESQMVFKKSKIPDLVAVKNFGTEILCPAEECEIVEPDVVLVPGLGFTEQGMRLGRGKGFYDRYLEKYKGLIIGIGFDLQIEKKLPTDHHDQNMNLIVTEKRVIDCRKNIKTIKE